ncbi:G-protein coupled receptor Mth2-like isoform X2 [Anopheles aquasalis]|uniref:G-protein coupled receptor Mth2-like isoform X2 n=1 Tax=Anopheles aquasalis TaxID=42839 RepID=UPI00215B52E5|nr:G-protein coupled receptor Mth2-like isoform X2 [Anopheles aquasalis]
MPCILHSTVRLLKWFVVWLLCSVYANDVQLCSVQESVDITNGTIAGDGGIDYDGVRYSASQYFQDGNTRRGCICLVRQCIYACVNEYWTNYGLKELLANVSGASGENTGIVNPALEAKYHMILKQPYCAGDFIVPKQRQVKITSKGELNVVDYFCILPKTEMGEFHALYCDKYSIAQPSDLYHQIHALDFLVVFPLLVATFVVYAILPELMDGKSVMCYVACLTVSYLFLAMEQLNAFGYKSHLYTISAYILYFTLLASFFWLNVIYWLLGESRGQMTKHRKFLYCSLHAWGAPILILASNLLFDHTELMGYELVTNVGEEASFLKPDKETEARYLHLVLLISANIVPCTITAMRNYLSNLADASTITGNSGSLLKLEKDRNRIGQHLSLFFIMGIARSLDIIKWQQIDPKTAYWLWLVYIVNALGYCLWGIFILFRLVCNQIVLQLLYQRFGRRENTPREDYTAYSIPQLVDVENPKSVLMMHQSE